MVRLAFRRLDRPLVFIRTGYFHLDWLAADIAHIKVAFKVERTLADPVAVLVEPDIPGRGDIKLALANKPSRLESAAEHIGY